MNRTRAGSVLVDELRPGIARRLFNQTERVNAIDDGFITSIRHALALEDCTQVLCNYTYRGDVAEAVAAFREKHAARFGAEPASSPSSLNYL